MSVFLIRKRFFRTGRGPRAGADRKAALRGDREVMFVVVMTVVNYPGAEVNWCVSVQRPSKELSALRLAWIDWVC